MAVTVPPAPYKTPIADKSGYMAPAWTAWFRELFLRIGGTVAPSNLELEALIDLTEIEADIATLQSDVSALQLTSTANTAAIALLRNDLEQGRQL